ncbi:unnamed protein product [Amaranthus hypochondriacus]
MGPSGSFSLHFAFSSFCYAILLRWSGFSVARVLGFVSAFFGVNKGFSLGIFGYLSLVGFQSLRRLLGGFVSGWFILSWMSYANGRFRVGFWTFLKVLEEAVAVGVADGGLGPNGVIGAAGVGGGGPCGVWILWCCGAGGFRVSRVVPFIWSWSSRAARWLVAMVVQNTTVLMVC